MGKTAWGIVLASAKDQQLATGAQVPFLNLGSQPVITYSLRAFQDCPEIAGVVVVVPPERVSDVRAMTQVLGFSKAAKIVPGQPNRTAAVLAALAALEPRIDWVVLHDAARPFVTVALILETLKAARKCGAAVAACPLPEIVKEVVKGCKVKQTLAENAAWVAQTPQAFRAELLRRALDAARKRKLALADEAAAVEMLRQEVWVVPSTNRNLKIDSADDLLEASRLLASPA